MQADFILRDATLVDGSGQSRYRAHIAVSGQRISQIGDFDIPAGIPIIDAAGLVAAPGFIDSHTHDDGYLLAHPDMRSEEHTSELQSLMRISYAVFCLKTK